MNFKILPPLLIGFLAATWLLPGLTQDAVVGLKVRTGFDNFHHQAAREKKAHVVFLGGSITQNAKGHTAMVPDQLRALYPETDFTFTNAGLSSTCSVSGAFRLNEHALKKGPVDLLIVEFAVNDDQDAGHDRKTAIRGLEGIIIQTRRHNPKADILSVHFVNPGMLKKIQNGENPVSISAHEAVTEHHGITSVNVAEALAAEIKSDAMSWEDYGGTHPKPDGYRFASDLIMKALEAGSKPVPDTLSEHPVKAPLDSFSYSQAQWIDPQQASWLGGWKFGKVGKDLLPVGSIREDYRQYGVLRSEEPGSTLYLNFYGKAIGAFILAGPDAGTLEYNVDSGDWKTIDLFHRHSRGLNYPRSVLFADELSGDGHQIVIRISKERNPDSKGTAASILFFENSQ